MKITACAAIFKRAKIKQRLRSGRLDERANALGTKYFANLARAVENGYPLEIGFILARSRFLRPGAVPSERGGFATMLTLSHRKKSFQYYTDDHQAWTNRCV